MTTALQMATTTTLQTSDHLNELKKEFLHGTLTLCVNLLPYLFQVLFLVNFVYFIDMFSFIFFALTVT